MKRIKEKLAAGERVIVFSIARMLHPTVIEMFGLAGAYDGFWIDQEHGGATYEQIQLLALAGRANELETFVRLAPTDYAVVTHCFEAGAGGVMAAQIHSAAQASEFLSWACFPPLGARGLNTGGFDGRFTHLKPAEFVESANQDRFVAIQIETRGALDEVEEIAALEGVDHVFIGPSDLSMSLGVVGEFHGEVMWDAIAKVAQAAKQSGKTWGVLPPDPKFAERAVELGCSLLSIANDPLVMKQGIAAIKTGFSSSFPT